MLQHKNIPNLVEGNACVDSTTTIHDKTNSMDEFQNHEIFSAITSHSDNSYGVENIISHKVVECSSRFYKDEEAKSLDSSDENYVMRKHHMKKMMKLVTQVEMRTMIMHTHLHISDENWEEESNDESEYSCESKGMSSCSETKNEVSSLYCINQLEVENIGEEFST